jgi:hypothetical protein
MADGKGPGIPDLATALRSAPIYECEGDLMLAHELLRAAATIVEAGWAAGCDAQDLEGRAIPLFRGDGRATINVAAARFSAYGAICKALSESRQSSPTQIMWGKLRDLARAAGAK